MSSYQYRKSHCDDKTVVRSSYLHNGISYTGKMTPLYWISPPAVFVAINNNCSDNVDDDDIKNDYDRDTDNSSPCGNQAIEM